MAVLGSVFPLERSKLKLGKQAQKLQAQCKAIGYTEELAKPRPFELKNLMMERANAQGTALPDGAATALLERCGEDPFCWKMKWTSSVPVRLPDRERLHGGRDGHSEP